MFSFVVSLPSTATTTSSPSTQSNSAQDVSSNFHRGTVVGDKWVESISLEPKAFIYHNFLSKEECEYLIGLAKPYMQRSRVFSEANPTGSVISSVRTSTGAYLTRGGDKTIRDIEQRIADWTLIPVDHGEGLHVLHYEDGQRFEPHYDYSVDSARILKGGGRMATVLMYLTDVEEGGETVFPKAKGKYSDVPCWDKLSAYGKGGLSVRPKAGDALLFYSMKYDGSLDPSSLHAGCPVIKGDKWSCTKWLHRAKIY